MFSGPRLDEFIEEYIPRLLDTLSKKSLAP